MATATPSKTYTTAEIKQIIDQEARKLGVDPLLAEAVAQNESGGNPNAVGDNGTSFGLFQLHKGGELGSLTPTQAFDPATNAHVALTEFAAQMKSHPNIDPGQLAALSQRPASPTKYAETIDAKMKALVKSGWTPSGGVVSQTNGASVQNASLTGGASVQNASLTGDAAGAIASALNPFDGIATTISSRSFWMRCAFILGGFIIVMVAIAKFTDNKAITFATSGGQPAGGTTPTKSPAKVSPAAETGEVAA